MKLFTTSAIALMAGLSASAAAAQYGGYSSAPTPPPTVPQTQSQPDKAQSAQGQRQVRPSSRALKALSELQAAVKSKDATAISSKMAAAQAVVSTNEDRFILAQLQLQRAADTNDTAAAMAAMDAVLATGVLQPAESAPLLKNLSGLRFNAKQYDAAAAVIDKRLQLNSNDIEAIGLLAEIRNTQGRPADAVAALQRGIQLQSAGGRRPEENWLKRAAVLAYNAKLANAPDLARQWVAAYPSPASWRDSIAIFRNMTRPPVEGTLDLLRLMNAAGALTQPDDFDLYATAAAEQNNFNEAQAIIDQGVASKRIDPTQPRFRDLIAGLKTKPMPTPAELADAAKTVPMGSTLIKIGDRYYGMGKYTDAAEVYRRALTKPGTDANLANLHIGMALARSGDKAGAATALTSVSGPLAEVAKFWLLYVQNGA